MIFHESKSAFPPFFVLFIVYACINNRKDPTRRNHSSSAATTPSRETTRASCRRSDSRPASSCNPATTTATTSLPPCATRSERATPKRGQSTTVMRRTSTAICITNSIGIGCTRLPSRTAWLRRRTSTARSTCRCWPGSSTIWSKGLANDCPSSSRKCLNRSERRTRYSLDVFNLYLRPSMYGKAVVSDV